MSSIDVQLALHRYLLEQRELIASKAPAQARDALLTQSISRVTEALSRLAQLRTTSVEVERTISAASDDLATMRYKLAAS